VVSACQHNPNRSPNPPVAGVVVAEPFAVAAEEGSDDVEVEDACVGDLEVTVPKEHPFSSNNEIDRATVTTSKGGNNH
jgi:hypothetical protein